MNARDAVAMLPPASPAMLAASCPWCHNPLDGHVFASFVDGRMMGLMQTKRIGHHDYTWQHNKDGCRVPSLDRLDGPVARMALKYGKVATEVTKSV